MEEPNILPDCCDDDVVTFTGKIFKVGQLRKIMAFVIKQSNHVPHTISNALRQKGLELNLTDTKQLLDRGIGGEILKIGDKGWKRGHIRMRVSLEFVSDEPDPLQPQSRLYQADDLRRYPKPPEAGSNGAIPHR